MQDIWGTPAQTEVVLFHQRDEPCHKIASQKAEEASEDAYFEFRRRFPLDDSTHLTLFLFL